MSRSNPNEITREQGTSLPGSESAQIDHPKTIGRYRVEKVLGQGGFGVVYLARDEKLDRQVAVKVPHSDRIANPQDVVAYLAEARTVANLDHPNIVPVHDVGSTNDCPCYVVSKYIPGVDLAERLKQNRMNYWESAKLIATVAEALHYAHKAGLVHRDVKPGNILIGIDGTPHVVDFGLALREENIGKGPRSAGTPAYMSPEQARGEGHRVDGRSDIFSLGVVFYQMLSGRRPFRGDTQTELLEQVTTYEPRPLRQYDEKLPKELARICYKAMAKRASERYSSAHDMADDLRHFLTSQTFIESGTPNSGMGTRETAVQDSNMTASNGGPNTVDSIATSSASIGLVSTNRPPVRIVPKGLRSFDSHDADFFLELLPGPRDRDGLPDRLRFWKNRIEETDSDHTFEVGLIYGPSGCGKSSFVKAGLLPRLSDDIVPVYVEATQEETESRLLKGIRKCCPSLDETFDLKETMAALRRGQGVPTGKKLLIVLDQFEQWLHAKKDEDNTELVQALRQCDGGRVQCILMVRDDFWLAVSRFLHALEIRLVEGHNVALSDLFDLDHARRVLGAFGRAFGRLPEKVSDTTKEQIEFLKQSVAGLAQDGKVICVRLALYAEMMRSKPWTMSTFNEVGGTAGVGVTFLEETFSSAAASPEHRYHQNETRAVLQNLLPESGLNIKGYMRSYSELLETSGYASRAKEFDDLIRILDSEVRLITPTDPDGVDVESGTASSAESGKRYFQLAHDYLVPSLRDWLTRKQKETKRGRAELRLADRSVSWTAVNENRFLPSWFENLSIRFLTDKKSWSPTQRAMMKRASWVHGVRTLMVGTLVAAIAVGAFAIRNSTRNRQKEIEATRLVEGLLQADTSQVGNIILELSEYRKWADDDLEAAFKNESDDSNAKLHAGLALLPVNEAAMQHLQSRLLTVPSMQFEHVRNLMAPHINKDKICEHYWRRTRNESSGDLPAAPGFRSQNPKLSFQAACALATFDAENEKWKDKELQCFVANQLVHVLPSELLPWRNALRPVHQHLIDPLSEIYKDESQGEQVRSFATDALTDYLAEDAGRLFDLLASANEQQFEPVFAKLARHPARAVELGIVEFAKSIANDASEVEKEFLAKRQANTAIMLLRLDHPRESGPNAAKHVWPILGFSPDPRVRSYIIDWFAARGGKAMMLAERFQLETDVTVKRALLLALGQFEADGEFLRQHQAFIDDVLIDVFRDSPDAGLHAAAEWLLRKFRHTDELEVVIRDLRDSEEQLALKLAEKDWFINEAGQMMVIVDAGEFQMGSPESEPGHYGNEKSHRRKIHRRFAISSKHITKSEYREFSKSNGLEYHSDKDTLQTYMQTEDSPMISMTWYEAAAYCNWLSEQEGIPEDQWCFEPNEEGKYAGGMKAKKDFLELAGYRLPTEAEWEFACRAGTTTSRYYGLSVELLEKYAWYAGNNSTRTWPVGLKKPNDFGLFDMQGNCYDWCYDSFIYDPAGENDSAEDGPDTEPTADTDNRMLRGGGFINPEANVRSASRYFSQPKNRRLTNSFRVVRTIATVD